MAALRTKSTAAKSRADAPARTRPKRPKSGTTVEHLRTFALSLPGAVETVTWGSPHFRVGGKIFGGLGTHEGRAVTSAKLEKAHAEALMLDPRFSAAPYVGRYGWVQFALDDVTPEELERLVAESHRLVGPKRQRAAAAPKRQRAPVAPKQRRARSSGPAGQSGM